MNRVTHRLGIASLLAGSLALALVGLGPPARAQSHRSGSIYFTRRSLPQEFTGSPRNWATANRVDSYDEDVQSHVWRVRFMAFMNSPPNAGSVTLTWFHPEGNHVRRPISNETIELTDQTNTMLRYQTALTRAPDQFEPMERYEAVISVDDARGSHSLASGTIQLIGIVPRVVHSGTIDFNGPTPP